ncbi:MAG: putative molybdenum carrier protein [Desulfobacterales bacterium]|nr:putative molybdenum carrier protein [Desulfobacterales bacterium]
MIKKIISGGQTGADQAALDVAIELDIPHGGWVPKGRLTEKGPLPPRYQLLELQTENYEKRTEQNVLDSDGTLILSHGELTGGSERTHYIAMLNQRPCLHINLLQIIPFEAVLKIIAWIEENNIEVLNVAGSRESKDPYIYQATVDVLEAVLCFNKTTIESETTQFCEDILSKPSEMPKNIKEVVNRLIRALSLNQKTKIVNLDENELIHFYEQLDSKIRSTILKWLDSKELLKACGVKDTDVNNIKDAGIVIMKELWKTLQQKRHIMRIVK